MTSCKAAVPKYLSPAFCLLCFVKFLELTVGFVIKIGFIVKIDFADYHVKSINLDVVLTSEVI